MSERDVISRVIEANMSFNFYLENSDIDSVVEAVRKYTQGKRVSEHVVDQVKPGDTALIVWQDQRIGQRSMDRVLLSRILERDGDTIGSFSFELGQVSPDGISFNQGWRGLSVTNLSDENIEVIPIKGGS